MQYHFDAISKNGSGGPICIVGTYAEESKATPSAELTKFVEDNKLQFISLNIKDIEGNKSEKEKAKIK